MKVAQTTLYDEKIYTHLEISTFEIQMCICPCVINPFMTYTVQKMLKNYIHKKSDTCVSETNSANMNDGDVHPCAVFGTWSMSLPENVP